MSFGDDYSKLEEYYMQKWVVPVVWTIALGHSPQLEEYYMQKWVVLVGWTVALGHSPQQQSMGLLKGTLPS